MADKLSFVGVVFVFFSVELTVAQLFTNQNQPTRGGSATSVIRPSSSGGGSKPSEFLFKRPQETSDSSGAIEVKPGNLSCYSCKLDFRKKEYNMNHPCLGKHNGQNVSDDFLVNCGPLDIYCRAERTEVNGILTLLTRECTNQCYYGCRPKGFGINIESCAECCIVPGCNHMYPESGAVLATFSLKLLCFCFTVVFLHKQRISY